MAHCQKKNIKTLVFWDTSQLIQLINMNHKKFNKYLKPYKFYNKLHTQ
jgi:hypothetical protein